MDAPELTADELKRRLHITFDRETAVDRLPYLTLAQMEERVGRPPDRIDLKGDLALIEYDVPGATVRIAGGITDGNTIANGIVIVVKRARE